MPLVAQTKRNHGSSITLLGRKAVQGHSLSGEAALFLGYKDFDVWKRL
jgi:hypothetical protein